MKLDANYWQSRYEEDNAPWDLGLISPAILEILESLENKSMQILIPGSGRGHEAVYLRQKGFHNVYLCDWAPGAFDYLLKQHPSYPKELLLIQDFFTLTQKFDLILEQTFFCALPKILRQDYARKMANLLNVDGLLTGLLFASEFEKPGPPFGGTKTEYISVLELFLEVDYMELATNSIPPRQGNELLFRAKQKPFH